jgi:signal transduction protein with GAF and PtsI domain
MTASPSPEVAGLMMALGDALGTATRPASLATELKRAVTEIRSLYAAAACSCARLQPDQATLRFVAADGVGAEAIVGVDLAVGRGIAGWVAMSGQPIVTTDVARDERFARDVAESTDYIPQTILAAPLADDQGQVLGVLEVLDPQSRGSHAGHDLDTLGVLASQVARIVALCEVYDALGSTVLATLARSSSGEDFSSALSELRQASAGRDDLGAMAEAFHTLSAAGEDATALATRILGEVATYVRTRR